MGAASELSFIENIFVFISGNSSEYEAVDENLEMTIRDRGYLGLQNIQHHKHIRTIVTPCLRVVVATLLVFV